MKHIYQQCEILMTYPIVTLFTSDTPSSKEKKEEARCTKLVDSFYKIDSDVHQGIRNLLHDVQASFLLMCNTVALEDTFTSTSRLQARFEHHRKHIQSVIKSEPSLKNYYSLLQKADWFGTVLKEVLEIAEECNFEVNVQECKKIYFDNLKFEQKDLKGE